MLRDKFSLLVRRRGNAPDTAAQQGGTQQSSGDRGQIACRLEGLGLLVAYGAFVWLA